MGYPERERKLAEVTEQIKAKVQAGRSRTIAIPHKILPTNPTEAMQVLAAAINDSIHEAKLLGVSPEKLAPLYNSLKQQLEVLAEIQGSLDRSTKVMNLTKIDLRAEIEEYAKAIELSR